MLAALLTHTHPHTKNNEKIMKNNENPTRRKEHTSLIHVSSTSITIQVLIVIAQRKKRNFLLTLLNAATDDQVFM